MHSLHQIFCATAWDAGESLTQRERTSPLNLPSVNKPAAPDRRHPQGLHLPAPRALPAAQGRFRAPLLLPWAGCSWTPSRGPRCSPQPRGRHSPSGCSRYTAGRPAALSPRRRAEQRGRHRGAGDTALPTPGKTLLRGRAPPVRHTAARPCHGGHAFPPAGPGEGERPDPSCRPRPHHHHTHSAILPAAGLNLPPRSCGAAPHAATSGAPRRHSSERVRNLYDRTGGGGGEKAHAYTAAACRRRPSSGRVIWGGGVT